MILPPQRPAFAGAAGAARTDTEETTVTDTDTTPEEDTPEETPEESTSVRAMVDEAVRRTVARMNVGGARVTSGPPHPLARYATYQEAAETARNLAPVDGRVLCDAFKVSWSEWHDRRRSARALVDQVTPDNPGVMPPSWLTEVFGFIDAGRPVIEATGGPRSAGSTGDDISWPYYDGDLSLLVKAQTAEKTDINSVKVSLKKGTTNLATYAGGSDISLQLERRSSPSYVATYNQIMAAGYALTTEYKYENDLLNVATPLVFLPLTASADEWRAFLFAASRRVKTATGSPASVAALSSDVWEKVGGLPALYAPQYGTNNAAGTSSAAELAINVSGLPLIEAAGLPDGSAVVTNGKAASWVEDFAGFVTALDVSKLGHDVAIWGMGATAVFAPAGIIKASATAADPAGTKSK